MNSRGEPLLCVEFDAEIIHWRGPAPYLFVPVPEHHVDEIRYAARLASYGWGVVPVEARIGAADFTTSLFPKGETYLLPVKAVVQKTAGVGLGDNIHVVMRITGR
jgi:hypothetical protein